MTTLIRVLKVLNKSFAYTQTTLLGAKKVVISDSLTPSTDAKTTAERLDNMFDCVTSITMEWHQTLRYGKNEDRKIIIDALAHLIRNKCMLEELNLGCNNLTKEDMQILAAAIKQNDSLVRLNLQGNDLELQGVKILADAMEERKLPLDVNLRGVVSVKDARALSVLMSAAKKANPAISGSYHVADMNPQANYFRSGLGCKKASF